MPEHIDFGIREDGSLFWNGEAVTFDQLASRFAAAKAGLVRIGFVSAPDGKAP